MTRKVDPIIAERLRRKAENARIRGDIAGQAIATARFWKYIGEGR